MPRKKYVPDPEEVNSETGRPKFPWQGKKHACELNGAHYSLEIDVDAGGFTNYKFAVKTTGRDLTVTLPLGVLRELLAQGGAEHWKTLGMLTEAAHKAVEFRS